jgi:hypothetical protein
MGRRVIASFAFVCVFAPCIGGADVIITEIMFDLAEGSDSGREWVEVHNTGSEPVDLTEWRLYENDTNHGLKAVGSEMLAAGEYAIIADNPSKFSADWPSYDGPLFDSAFSLNNSGETLVMRCCGKEASDRDSVTYNATGGGNGDGLSLHRSGSSIVTANPSPGSGAIVQPAIDEPEPEPEPEPIVQKNIEEEKLVEPESEPEPETKAMPMTQEKVAPPVTKVVQEEKAPEEPENNAEAAGKEADDGREDQDEESPEIAPAPGAETQAAAAAASGAGDTFWWAGAGALSLLGAAGAYVMGRAGRSREKEWDIEEID